MVRLILSLYCIFKILSSNSWAAPTVDASIDSMNTQAHFPLSGTITITHEKQEKIDTRSFTLEGKPFETSFVKDVKMSASKDTVISIFSFTLPAQDKGLYVLPSISVKINHQIYQTIPSTYEVNETTATLSIPSNSEQPSSTAPPIFRLEASVKGPSTLYLGEKTLLFYRILYNRSVDLTQSQLPMVHPPHFQKVGDVQIKDYQIQNMTIQEIIQEVEASEIGTFELGPSFIEGYAYSTQTGQKVYEPHLLKANAPAVSLTVQPFPTKHQPNSFNGALGTIEIHAELKNAHLAFVGDNIELEITIKGIKNLTELHLPPLECQPGFSGFFQTSDLPPAAEVKENAKIFHVDLRPITNLIEQVPSIEVSSFDPIQHRYVIQKSQPLPLSVSSHTAKKYLSLSLPILAVLPNLPKWPNPILPPLELKPISSMPHVDNPSHDFKLNILWVFVLGFFLIFLQYRWHTKREKQLLNQHPMSETLLKQALKQPFFENQLKQIEKAFWHRLWEKKLIPYYTFDLDLIAKNPQLNRLHSFILQLQSLQYGLEKANPSEQFKKIAQEIFYSI